MYFQDSSPRVHHRIILNCRPSRLLLALLIGLSLLRPAFSSAQDSLITQEIRYRLPEAGQVYLVWAVNSDQMSPEDIRPAGKLYRKDGAIHKPMSRQGDAFVAMIQAPAGTPVIYGFWITRDSAGAEIEPIWDGRPDYQKILADAQAIEIETDLDQIKQAQARAVETAANPFVRQEIHYFMPEAGEVMLVWGINGWQLAPETIWPPQTMILDEKTWTPMLQAGDSFAITLQVPAGTTIEYTFLITKYRDGSALRPVWDNQAGGRIITTDDGLVERVASVKLPPNRPPTPILSAKPKFVTQEIHYYLPEAREVLLIWGINGWQPAPEELRLEGTTVTNKNMMRTPMLHQDNTFIAKIQVPTGATLNYGFSITKHLDGSESEPIWDGADNYKLVAAHDDLIKVTPKVTLSQDQGNTDKDQARFVTQEIQYQLPEAGEVFLIWGINGWQPVSEELRLEGTTVTSKNMMRTPMLRQDNIFVARIQVPAGATVHYGFSITKKLDGSELEPIWDGAASYKLVAVRDDLITIQGAMSLTKQITPNQAVIKPPWLSLLLLASLGLIVGVILLLRIRQGHLFSGF